MQVCSQTIEHQVSQCVPNTHISEQFVSKLRTSLQLIHFLLIRKFAVSSHTMKISFRHQVSQWLLVSGNSSVALAYVCKLVLGVDVFDLDFGVQIDSIKQPIKSNSVGSGNMSHCRTSSLVDHLDHCFVVFKDIHHSCLMRRIRVRGIKSTLLRSSIFP